MDHGWVVVVEAGREVAACSAVCAGSLCLGPPSLRHWSLRPAQGGPVHHGLSRRQGWRGSTRGGKGRADSGSGTSSDIPGRKRGLSPRAGRILPAALGKKGYVQKRKPWNKRQGTGGSRSRWQSSEGGVLTGWGAEGALRSLGSQAPRALHLQPGSRGSPRGQRARQLRTRACPLGWGRGTRRVAGGKETKRAPLDPGVSIAV